MQKTLGTLLLILGVSACCFAQVQQTPEIDPSMGGSAIALVAGVLLVIRSRKK